MKKDIKKIIMEDEDFKKLIEVVQNLPITKTFYSLKERGKCPYIEVVIRENNEITGAKLIVDNIQYYFHGTKQVVNGKEIKLLVEKKVETNPQGKKITTYKIPFDGWEVEIF